MMDESRVKGGTHPHSGYSSGRMEESRKLPSLWDSCDGRFPGLSSSVPQTARRIQPTSFHRTESRLRKPIEWAGTGLVPK